MQKKQISVIIPTYKRQKTLNQLLLSLNQQSLQDIVEIIVVDNEPSIDTRTLITKFNTNYNKSIIYLAHASGGNSGARNRGAQEAQGDLLVFTDDDLTFDQNWLLAYKDAFDKHPEMSAASGCTKPNWEILPSKWLSEYIGNKKVFPIYALMDRSSHFLLSDNNYFFSCNMAIRKSVLLSKGFHPEIFGSKTLGDGESGLNQELIREGHLIGYIPNAIAYHHISQERMTLSYICRWAWHLSGSIMYQRMWNKKRNFIFLLKEFFIILVKYLFFWLQLPFINGSHTSKNIDIQFQASVGLCRLTYLFWSLTDRKLQEILDDPNPYII